MIKAKEEVCEPIIPIKKYRELTGDYESTDVRVKERLQYLEEFCRAIAQRELENYAKEIKATR